MSRLSTDFPADAADDFPEPEGSSVPARAGSRFNAIMRVVRRLHLYAGLFLTPWVLLYGVTALLFNHPDFLADHPGQQIERDEVSATALGDLRPAEELAAEVVAALNAARKTPAAGSYRLLQPEAASYNRDRIFITAQADGARYQIQLDFAGAGGRIRTQGAAATGPAPDFARKAGLHIGPPLPERVKTAIPELLAARGVTAEEITITSAPDLNFLMEADGKHWRVTYNAQRGGVTARPAEEDESSLTTRSFLTRLHLSRGYPTTLGTRWFWAIAVDAMFVAMVFWACSGLFMWWQLKATRRWGVIVLLSSALCATFLALGMHRVLAG